MKAMDRDQRPREKLAARGEESLSDAELLAIILGIGTKELSVLELAQSLLERFGTLHALFLASQEDLMEHHGIGTVKALELKAVFSLARRFSDFYQKEPGRIAASEDAYLMVRDLFYENDKEKVVLLFLDTKERMIGRHLLSIGTLNRVLIHPRELFTEVLKRHAHSYYLCHNHPTNDLSPSKEDLRITDHLIKGSELLDVILQDHLICGAGGFYSFKHHRIFTLMKN